MSSAPDLETLTDDLYARPPAEFVAARDALAKAARDAGDRDLAAAIKALKRPSVGAWYLNTAARAGLDVLRDLLSLGEQLRDAQSGGDFAALRDLAGRRGRLVGDVVRALTVELAKQEVSATPAGLDEVRGTLASALADPAVAGLVERGRLDRPYSYGGFGEVTGGAVPERSAGATPRARGGDPASKAKDAEAKRAAEQAERERRLAEARRDLEAAQEVQATAAARRVEAEDDVQQSRARIEALTAELAAVRHELGVAEAELADALNSEKLADRRVERARRQLEE